MNCELYAARLRACGPASGQTVRRSAAPWFPPSVPTLRALTKAYPRARGRRAASRAGQAASLRVRAVKRPAASAVSHGGVHASATLNLI